MARGVYLLHFNPRYQHAGHYMGWAENIARRVREHQRGQARTKLTDAAARVGVKFRLARTWPGKDRHFERALKNSNSTLARLCPICKSGGVTKPHHFRRKKKPGLLARLRRAFS